MADGVAVAVAATFAAVALLALVALLAGAARFCSRSK
jgi:hypothetical protein